MSKDAGRIIEVDEVNFESEVLQSKHPVLVGFLAPWSSHCQTADLILEELVTLCAGAVKIVRVNADHNPDLGVWYEVQFIPTLLYFVNGSLRTRMVGVISKEAVLSRIQLSFPAPSAPL